MSAPAPELDITGRVALVTGAGHTNGIGFGIARALAVRGARVVVSASTQERAEASAKALVEATGVPAGSVAGFGADLTDAKAAWELVERTQAFGGGGVIDVLVNNAGAGVIPPRPVEAMQTPEELQGVCDSVFGVNVFGLLHCIRAATPYLKKSEAGRVINISSVSSERPLATMALYAASKAAVDSLTISMATELAAYGITVNSILPGPFETVLFQCIPEEGRAQAIAQVPLGRAGDPYKDMSGIIGFLASSSSAYTTGAKIKVSGGMWI